MAVLAVVLSAACGTRVRFVDEGATPTPTPSANASETPTPTATVSSSPAAPVSMDPLKLVRWWKVTSPAKGWAVSFGEELVTEAPCGELRADWQASPSGLFAAAVTGGAPACVRAGQDLAWFRTPRSFALVGDELVLSAPDGTVSARLSPIPAPAGKPAPTLSAGRRARLTTPAALPTGVAPAAWSTLQGRWVPRGKDAGNGRSYAAFAQDWTWRGSDGCNGAGGSFSIGAAGDFLSTSGATTLIGCNNSRTPLWVARARRVGFQSDALAFFDEKGSQLGRLYRAPVSRPAPTSSAIPR